MPLSERLLPSMAALLRGLSTAPVRFLPHSMGPAGVPPPCGILAVSPVPQAGLGAGCPHQDAEATYKPPPLLLNNALC